MSLLVLLIVLLAIELHPSDANIQQRGGFAFFALAKNNEENQKAIVDSKGISQNVVTRGRHESVAVVQQNLRCFSVAFCDELRSTSIVSACCRK